MRRCLPCNAAQTGNIGRPLGNFCSARESRTVPASAGAIGTDELHASRRREAGLSVPQRKRAFAPAAGRSDRSSSPRVGDSFSWRKVSQPHFSDHGCLSPNGTRSATAPRSRATFAPASRFRSSGSRSGRAVDLRSTSAYYAAVAIPPLQVVIRTRDPTGPEFAGEKVCAAAAHPTERGNCHAHGSTGLSIRRWPTTPHTFNANRSPDRPTRAEMTNSWFARSAVG
jgi:hypothetical protein